MCLSHVDMISRRQTGTTFKNSSIDDFLCWNRSRQLARSVFVQLAHMVPFRTPFSLTGFFVSFESENSGVQTISIKSLASFGWPRPFFKNNSIFIYSFNELTPS